MSNISATQSLINALAAHGTQWPHDGDSDRGAYDLARAGEALDMLRHASYYAHVDYAPEELPALANRIAAVAAQVENDDLIDTEAGAVAVSVAIDILREAIMYEGLPSQTW